MRAMQLVIAEKPSVARDLARILGATHLHAFYGQHQVVFIDRGKNDKLEPGHSLYVDRQGDGLDNATSYREARTTVSLDSEDLGAEHAHQNQSHKPPTFERAPVRLCACTVAHVCTEIHFSEPQCTQCGRLDSTEHHWHI